MTFGNRYAGLNLTYLPGATVEKMLNARVADETLSDIVFLQFKIAVNPR